MIKRAKKIISTNKKPYIVIISFAIIGSLLILITNAATPYAQTEHENATLTGGAQICNDINASGVQCVQFGTAPIDPPGTVQNLSSLSHFGVTYTFDKAYPAGKFANGEWWVKGPVVITRITPDAVGGQNGWMKSPITLGKHGFDSRSPNKYDASTVPNLPYTTLPDQAIVKAISSSVADRAGDGCDSGSNRSCIDFYSVLTVVSQNPPNNGAGVFRPGYASVDRNYKLVDNLQFNLLPSLAPVSGAPSLDSVKQRFETAQVDHLEVVSTEFIYPRHSGAASYAANRGTDMAVAALRLMNNEPIETKKASVVAYVQGGLDYWSVMKTGHIWNGQGGHGNARKLPIAFAAAMLNDTEMKTAIKESYKLGGSIKMFNENNQTYIGRNGLALYGAEGYSEDQYWRNQIDYDDTNRLIRDPYGYIDGGWSGTSYQSCCNSMPWKYTALAVRLIPEIKSFWDGADDAFLVYADRWVNHGAWSQPDPCAPAAQGGGANPNKPGECILDPDLTAGSTFTTFSCKAGLKCGRWPDNHGLNKNSGDRSSVYGNNMWSAYRPTVN